MALEDLTLLTIVLEFVPPLIVTFIYLLFFGKRKSKLIESFIILMYVKTITWFLLTIAIQPLSYPIGFNAEVDTSTLSWILITDMLFQFFVSLQEYLIWIMVSFVAVLFGILVLAAKLYFQDPLKMVFKNLIKRIIGKEPESDGYSGFRDRLNNITFEGLEPNPLDPKVQQKAWHQAWKDYVIIGLATLVPSITVYTGSLQNFIYYLTDNPLYREAGNYLLNIAIFLTWIYRFGYPASNRIAKAAGLHLGQRDLGAEMMRGVLGWFFRLNILITLYLLAEQALTVLTSDVSNAFTILTLYYGYGLLLAAPPIIFAVIVLPYAEDFSAIFYKRVIDGLSGAHSKIRLSNKTAAIKNILASLGTGVVVTGAFIGAAFASTLNYATQSFFAYGLFSDNRFLIFPGSVDGVVSYILNSISTPTSFYPEASVPMNNLSLIPPTTWTLLMLAIPFAAMILIGLLGYFVRGKGKGGSETFAFFSGVTVSVATYFILPDMDYILGASVTPATYAGEIFNRLRPVPDLPTDVELLWRLASQFIVSLPIYVFTALFILYFFENRNKWRETTGDKSSPLLHVEKRDIIDSMLMFVGGLIISIFGVWMLAYIIQNPDLVRDLLQALLEKIGKPDGLEGVLPPPVDRLSLLDPGGWFVIIAEHNIIRTLLMLVIGPVFWSAVLWFTRAEKTKSESNMGLASVVGLVILAAASILLTQFNAMSGLFNPYDSIWGFSTQLGLSSLLIFGIPVLLILGYIMVQYLQGKGIGAWWFPLFIFIFAIEYFVYDDQFTLIAIIALPVLIAGAYRLINSKHDDVKSEDFLITYVKFSFMSVAIAEVLSTALTISGIAIIKLTWGGNAWEFLAGIIPHAIIEIPVFLLAAALSIRVARGLSKTVQSRDWSLLPTQTRALLSDERTWRTFALIVFFLIIAAIIEAYVTPIIVQYLQFTLG
ncbi:MAG: stage II sporulation protein M [Candidatus Thorarchaeota archaeon]|nr:stage II sporulation protein M [Candidatus Thorarchaeota archaeon]